MRGSGDGKSLKEDIKGGGKFLLNWPNKTLAKGGRGQGHIHEEVSQMSYVIRWLSRILYEDQAGKAKDRAGSRLRPTWKNGSEVKNTKLRLPISQVDLHLGIEKICISSWKTRSFIFKTVEATMVRFLRNSWFVYLNGFECSLFKASVIQIHRYIRKIFRSSHGGSVVRNTTGIHKDVSPIPGLTQWVKDPALLYIKDYIYLLQILFHYSLLEDIEYSSLCYAVTPCCLSTTVLFVYLLIPNSQLLPTPSL